MNYKRNFEYSFKYSFVEKGMFANLLSDSVSFETAASKFYFFV